MKLRNLGSTLAAVLFISLTAAVISPAPISAASFDAGNIISDSTFTNKSAISANDIQHFLNRKNSVCLKNYQTHEPLGNNTYGGLVPASQAIWKAGQLFDINPQVLLVTLQKENGLITRTDCPSWRYRTAMGFGCPDGAPCDSQWFGLNKQLYQSARHFRGFYNQSPGWFIPFRPGSKYIQWHPNSSCGGSTVNIKNRATASLYSFTPYQPNSQALAAGYGTGNGCSSYGNRNFWLYFNSWFGSSNTGSSFSKMDTPRYMELKEDVYKKDLDNNLGNSGPIIPAGAQIYFTEKAAVNGEAYLRTKHDTDHGIETGIALSKLNEITVSYSLMDTPKWMEAAIDVHEIEPIEQRRTGAAMNRGSKVFFDQKYVLSGVLYLRSANDSVRGNNEVIPSSALVESSLDYTAFDMPRWMTPVKHTNTYNLQMYSFLSSAIPSSAKPVGSYHYFDYKTGLNGKGFASNGLPGASTYTGTPLEDLRNISGQDIKPLARDRTYKITKNTVKINLSTGEEVDSQTIAVNSSVHFSGYIVLGGQTYLRTSHDTAINAPTVIKQSETVPIEVNFQEMEAPRQLRAKAPTQKQDPVTLKSLGGVIQKGQVVSYSQKIVINGELYLRTQHDATNGYYRVVPFSSLQEI